MSATLYPMPEFNSLGIAVPAPANGVAGDFSGGSITATGSTTPRTMAVRAAGVINIQDYGAKCDGATDDSTALNAAIAAASTGTGAKIILPTGRTVIGSAIVASIPAGVTIIIEGMGIDVSQLYFSNATNGLMFTLQNSGTSWGAISLRGFGVLRGPTSPASANTGVSLSVAAASIQYTGGTSIRDVQITGTRWGAANQWQNSLVLNGITLAVLDNVRICAVNGTATDLGDVCCTITGSTTTQQYGTSHTLSNCAFGGGSCGLLINGYVQGVFITNSTIIGQYDSIRWLGVGPVVNYTTTAATVSGNVLQFAPNSLGSVLTGSVVNGTNIVPSSSVSAVNNAAGTITLNNNVTGTGVASGATIAIQTSYTAEDVSIVGCTLNAGHRGVLAYNASFIRVIGTTILQFSPGPATWAGVEYQENIYSSVSQCNILGQGGGNAATQYGVLIDSLSSLGSVPNTVVGNNFISCKNGAVYLQGTTQATTVVGNTCAGGANSIIQDIVGANAILANIWNGVTLDFTKNGNNVTLAHSLGINGSTPPGKPTVTGAKGGNAAVASLLTALASFGFITDSTTA